MKRKITFFMSLATCMSLNAQLIVATGSLSVPRVTHGSEVLANGKILVFGGDNGYITPHLVYKSAELYNNGTWSSTGNMQLNRRTTASVVLSNGNILVIGGENLNETKLASCEIYNVATGTWSYADSMNNARSAAIAITLNNGKVLAIGGDFNETCELYDETTNTWTSTGSLTVDGGFSWGDAVKLPNGNVLLVGRGTATAEIYNVSTGTWSQVVDAMSVARDYPTAILMNNGKVLVAGGGISKTSEVFDPATNLFEPSGNLGQYASANDLINLPDGRVLIYGTGSATSIETNALQIYNPTTGTWSYPGSVQINITTANDYTVNFLPNGKILYAGGRVANNNGTPACYIVNISPLGVDEITEEVFNVYPIPASNQITVSFENAVAANGYSYLLSNSLGQVISTTPVQNKETNISLSNVSELGIYFISLKNNMGEIIQTRKIIVE